MTRRLVLRLVALSLCLATLVWLALYDSPTAPVLPKPPAFLETRDQSELRARHVEFFKSDVEPSIAIADELNREAALRCVARIKQSFDGYRIGIQSFCSDVSSWSTRLGVISRMPGDWWYEKADVAAFVQEKFGKHLFTDTKLKEDIANAITQFRHDVSANQNKLLIDIRAAISTADVPSLPNIDHTQFSMDVASQLTIYSSEAAQQSVVNLILIEIVSGIGGAVAEQLLVQLVSRLSAMAATSAATAGGATAGGAAVGGGSGSLGGPIGVAAGLAVGIVVGSVIDWWMSGRFESVMAAQLNGMIDDLTNHVIVGSAAGAGLKEALQGSCDVMRDAYEESLWIRIVDGAST